MSTPFRLHETTGEPFVAARYAEISDQAVAAEDISCFTFQGEKYISLLETIEFLEESLEDRERLAFFCRALSSF